MIVRSRVVIAGLGVVGALGASWSCSSGGSAPGGSAGSAGSGAVIAKGSAGGFSASLSADLAKDGVAARTPSGAADLKSIGADPKAGSATDAKAGSAASAGSASDAKAGSASDLKSNAADPKAGSAASAKAGSAAAAADAKAGSAATPIKDAKPSDAKTGAKAGSGAIVRPPDKRVVVKPAPELAAIKLDLEPNWDRDLDEAATISFVLKVPNSDDTRLFSFHYGIDDASAPTDHDAYMHWLADRKQLEVTLERQRGAAWYLEGTDGTGAPAFRYRVIYGGKKLICYGPLYRDAASNPLGDLRDKVVMAAKKICETLAL